MIYVHTLIYPKLYVRINYMWDAMVDKMDIVFDLSKLLFWKNTHIYVYIIRYNL